MSNDNNSSDDLMLRIWQQLDHLRFTRGIWCVLAITGWAALATVMMFR